MKKEKIKLLESRIGYTFVSRDLLLASLFYPQSRTQQTIHKYYFQRLEFLGDRVLGLALSMKLFDMYPTEAEGGLAKRLAELASRNTCLKIARDIGLEEFAHGPKGVLRDTRSMALAHMMEALIASVYLDSNMDAVIELVGNLWKSYLHDLLPPQDCKSLLQEWLQKNLNKLPLYEVTDVQGPGHEPNFIVQVSVDGHPELSFGSGMNKREAEQAAAKALLGLFGVKLHTHPNF